MDIEKQVAILMQGTQYGDESLSKTMETELRKRLLEARQEGRPLRVYCGYDPRKADLHIGHTVTMRKLRQFQELGHEVTFLIGTYTSLIGDPSDQDKLRPQLTPEEVYTNAQTYAEQAFHILDRTKTTVRFNAEWLSKLSFADLIGLASNFTVQQFFAREAFKQRWDRGDGLYVHELFYSLMQGYDAYHLNADVQVGGTDQLFNIVTAARKIMTYLGARPNIAIIMGILPGTDGVVKMSKSLGNHIPINTSAEDMFGKVMSIPDFAMPAFARLVTRWTPERVAEMVVSLETEHGNPRNVKMDLAREIVGCFYGDDAAESAQDLFVSVFQKHQMPAEIEEYHYLVGQTVLDVLVSSGLVSSRSEGRRLVEQKGVRLDGAILSDALVVFPHPGVLQVGKRHFRRITQ